MEILKKLLSKGYNVNLISFSAIDKYLFGKIIDRNVYVSVDADIVNISKIFENLKFNSLCYDFTIETSKRTYHFCLKKYPKMPFNIQYFTYDLNSDKFKNLYESFTSIKKNETYFCGDKIDIFSIIDASILLSKYKIALKNFYPEKDELNFIPLNSNEQKRVLVSILEAPYSFQGFDFLLKTGFIKYYWSELYEMTKVEQIKDFHPEGNVWNHTLEMLKHRKKKNLILSLAILFHDIGKAYSCEFKDKKFYKHAQIGSKIAEKFLKKLEFDENIVNNVKMLVKYHMLPENIERIPEIKLKKVIEEVDLNLLFDLYRADISSSYRDLTKYFKIKKFIKKII